MNPTTITRLVAAAVIVLAAATTAGTASAGAPPGCDTVLNVPLDTVIHNNTGTFHDLGSIDTSAHAGGTGTAQHVNPDSVHPGNHLHINTGFDTVTLFDVEDAPGAVKSAGPFTLGSSLSVTLELGGDGVFSGGGSIDVCVEDAPPPTTVPETTVPPTTVPDTTPATTAPETAPATTSPGTTPETTPDTTAQPTPTTTEPAPSTTQLKEIGEGEQGCRNLPGKPTCPTTPSTSTTSSSPPPTSDGGEVAGETQTLPETGTNPALPAGAALLITLGGGILYATRRRSTS